MNEGWIKLHRQILDDPLYFAEPFTRMQAFIDLILIANIKQTTFFKRGIKITVERGQTARSEDELAERWKWSRGKVRRFLMEQQNDGKIVQQKSHVCSCISVVNYDKYQIDDTTDSTTNDTTDSTTDSTTKNKKEKNNILSTSTTRTHVRDGTTEKDDTEDDIDKDIEQLKASAIWIEQICMKHKTDIKYTRFKIGIFCISSEEPEYIFSCCHILLRSVDDKAGIMVFMSVALVAVSCVKEMILKHSGSISTARKN